MSTTLDEFRQYLDKIKQFNHITTLLYWDMRTCLPRMGLEAHGDAMAYFSTEHFTLSTSDELGAMLDKLASPEEFNELDDTMKFIVTRMKKNYDREKRIPKDFYEEYVRTQTAAETAWEDAKNSADFSIFAPHLEKIIQMTREMTGYTDPGRDVYDALLDTYEEGMDSAAIDTLFDALNTLWENRDSYVSAMESSPMGNSIETIVGLLEELSAQK